MNATKAVEAFILRARDKKETLSKKAYAAWLEREVDDLVKGWKLAGREAEEA